MQGKAHHVGCGNPRTILCFCSARTEMRCDDDIVVVEQR